MRADGLTTCTSATRAGRWCFGVLAAALRRRFGGLRYARNITDVDDKINAAAKEQGLPIAAITDRFAAAYREDMGRAGRGRRIRPDMEPEATKHIARIVAMIERLVADGHAYAAEGRVLFAVASFAGYGKLSRRDPEDMLAGARVEVAPYKRSRRFRAVEAFGRDPARLGFALGPRPPGLAHRMLGDGRGPPRRHHRHPRRRRGPAVPAPRERSRAERMRARRQSLRALVAGNGMLNFGGAKMAKSVGNIQRVHELVREHPPEALRYALLSAHYRQPLGGRMD